jgi:hypothetical protein
MVMHLAESLDIPLRERNILLQAAGYAPVFRERPLDDPALARARTTLDLVLRGHSPNPALVVNRHWEMLAANDAVAPLLIGVDPDLVKPPVNVMRVSLHPRGLAPLIVNLAEWRGHLLDRLRRQHRATLDPTIGILLKEVSSFPYGSTGKGGRESHTPADDIVVPLKLRTQAGVLSFFSTVTMFGTPMDITLSEVMLEAFYPADPETAEILRAAAAQRGQPSK